MLNLIDDEIYFQISDAVLEKNFKAAFEVSEKIYSNGWNFVDFVNGLVEHFRNISTLVITKTTDFIESSGTLKKKYAEYIDKYTEGDLLRILSFLTKTQNELRISQNQKLKVEISLAHLIGFEKSSTITELLSKSNSGNLEETKKKTEIVKNYSPEEEIPTKTEKLIPEFKIEKSNSLKKPAPIEKPKEKESESKESEVSSSHLSKVNPDIDSIKKNWENYKSIITKERFTLGPLLKHTIPSLISNDNLIIDVNHNEDLQILNSASDFLTKRFNKIFNLKLQIKFNYNKNAIISDSSSTVVIKDESEDIFKNHPLVKSIITELGGKEIK
jgi:DNA polymerase-3 subunit gamma/tau